MKCKECNDERVLNNISVCERIMNDIDVQTVCMKIKGVSGQR